MSKEKKPAAPAWNASCGGCGPDELCGCCTDSCSCLAVWCCPCIVISQLWERVMGPPGSCMKILLGIFFAMVVISTLSSIAQAEMRPDLNRYMASCFMDTGCRGRAPMLIDYPAGAAANSIQSCLGLAIMVMLCLVRKRVRETDKLEQVHCTCIDGCEDCCCACCCATCTECLLIRRVIGIGKYSLTSPTGSIERVGEGAPLASV